MMKLNLQLFAIKGITSAVKSAVKGVEDYKKKTGSNVAGTAVQTGSANSAVQGAVKSTGQTSSNTGSGIKGVNQSTQNKMNSAYQKSSQVTNAQAEADKYLNNVKNLSSVTDIVDQSTWNAINKQFNVSSAYTEAMNYTNSLLEKLSSGRTSYTDRINALMNDIQNREKFEYDVDSDMLFQQSLASAMSSGKTAMQDTIGQASALTGGYGNTYATSAGNQAYNSFIQDAYNNLPEYYQMALEAYQMEGDEMYKQLAMLSDADATEYQRTYDSWSANFSNAQQMYNNEYTAWQDSVNNAFNSANLQLNEHGQLFDQAYNAYTAVQNNANTLYAQEYQKWADEVNNALNYAKFANSDYWNNAEMEYKKNALKQDDEHFYASLNAKTSGGSGSDTSDEENLYSASATQKKEAIEAFNKDGREGLLNYISGQKDGMNTTELIDYVYGYYGLGEMGSNLTAEKTHNSINGFLWTGNLGDRVDKGDKVKINGKEYDLKDLPEFLGKYFTDMKKGKTKIYEGY